VFYRASFNAPANLPNGAVFNTALSAVGIPFQGVTNMVLIILYKAEMRWDIRFISFPLVEQLPQMPEFVMHSCWHNFILTVWSWYWIVIKSRWNSNISN
jgi:hypothetical protein